MLSWPDCLRSKSQGLAVSISVAVLGGGLRIPIGCGARAFPAVPKPRALPLHARLSTPLLSLVHFSCTERGEDTWTSYFLRRQQFLSLHHMMPCCTALPPRCSQPINGFGSTMKALSGSLHSSTSSLAHVQQVTERQQEVRLRRHCMRPSGIEFVCLVWIH